MDPTDAVPVAADRDGRDRPVNPGSARVVLITATAALGGFLFGYDTAVINGAVNAVRAQYQVSPGLLGVTVAVAQIGAALGALGVGRLADRFGRVRMMLVAAMLFLVSAFGTGFAFSVYDLGLWRLVGGMGVGAASVLAPAYIAEVSPARLRGRLGSLQQMAIVLGIFVAFLVDFGLVQGSGGAALPFWGGLETWRWMFLSLAVPAVLYGVLALTLPESPRQLVAVGDIARARSVLTRFVGGEVEHRIAEIQRTLHTERRRPRGLSVLRMPDGRIAPIVWVGLWLSLFQQLTGVSVAFYYSSVLWEAVGFTEQDAVLTSVITSVTNIVATAIAIALIDRVGRRPLLLVGAAGQAVSLLVMAVVFGMAPVVGGQPQLGGAGIVAVIAANAYVVFFGVSWGPVVWVMLGEMFGNRIRAVALAVAAGGQWLMNALVSGTFPALSGLGLGTAYGLYSFFGFAAVAFVFFFVGETKGKELEEMSETAGARG